MHRGKNKHQLDAAKENLFGMRDIACMPKNVLICLTPNAYDGYT